MSLSRANIEVVAGPPSRSTFITVLAWLSIAGSGFVTFISLMQAAMFFLLFRDKFPIANREWPGHEQLPAFVQFLFSHPELFFATFWSLALLTLVASIGLLRRKNWARLYFIAVLALGCVWNLGGIWVQRQMLSTMPTSMRGAPAEFARNFELMGTIISIGTTIMAIAITILFVWLIKRLLSPAIRAEFDAP
jgi:hypothetical protein